MDEKRRCHRFKIELPAWFKASPIDEAFSLGTTIDVSALGVSLVSKAELELGQVVHVQIKLPSEEILTIKTRVVWIRENFRTAIREYQVGLKILEPVNPDESRFVRFCAERLLEFYKDVQNIKNEEDQ